MQNFITNNFKIKVIFIFIILFNNNIKSGYNQFLLLQRQVFLQQQFFYILPRQVFLPPQQLVYFVPTQKIVNKKNQLEKNDEKFQIKENNNDIEKIKSPIEIYKKFEKNNLLNENSGKLLINFLKDNYNNQNKIILLNNIFTIISEFRKTEYYNSNLDDLLKRIFEKSLNDLIVNDKNENDVIINTRKIVIAISDLENFFKIIENLKENNLKKELIKKLQELKDSFYKDLNLDFAKKNLKILNNYINFSFLIKIQFILNNIDYLHFSSREKKNKEKELLIKYKDYLKKNISIGECIKKSINENYNSIILTIDDLKGVMNDLNKKNSFYSIKFIKNLKEHLKNINPNNPDFQLLEKIKNKNRKNKFFSFDDLKNPFNEIINIEKRKNSFNL